MLCIRSISDELTNAIKVHFTMLQMEVSGRRSFGRVGPGTAADAQILCQPCEEGSKRIKATRYCKECQQNICNDCAEQHKRFNSMKDHTFIEFSKADDSQLPSSVEEETRSNSPTIKCQNHKDKVLEFYCPAHNVTSCSVCAVLIHKKCKLDYVPEISARYLNSDEYSKLKFDLEELDLTISLYLREVDTHVKETNEHSHAIIEEIRTFREEMNQFLLKKEQELISELEQMRREDVEQLTTVKGHLTNAKSEINDTRSKLDNLEGQKSDLLITSKHSLVRLYQMQKDVEKNLSKKSTFFYAFKPSKLCADLKSSRDALGSIQRLNQDRQSKFSSRKSQRSSTSSTSSMSSGGQLNLPHAKILRGTDIVVRASQDKKDCAITGIAFSPPNTLLLADCNNQCVKSIDNTKSAITNYLPLGASPWDITTFGPDQAAVTIPNKKTIQIISTNGGLSLSRTIPVKGECHGIDTTTNKIIVSHVNPGKVDIMDHSGNVLQTVSTDARKKSLFTRPGYVRVSNEGGQEVIYVSDFDTFTLTKLLMTGDVLYKYKDENLRRPRGPVASDDGYLLVCGYASDNLQLISSSGKKVRSFLKNRDGVKTPMSVCFGAGQNVLYVSCDGDMRNMLKVYQID